MAVTIAYSDIQKSLHTAVSPCLLIGNGFSCDFDSKIFSYKTLVEKANLGKHRAAIEATFNELRSADFEAAIAALQRSATLIPHFTPADGTAASSSIVANMNAAGVRLRDALGETISLLHPNAAADLVESQCFAAQRFLDPYSHIFTVNYDLLLYWVLMRNDWHRQKQHGDGFRSINGKLVWRRAAAESDWAPQTIHYLHGALHLQSSSDGVEKVRFGYVGNMIDQIRSQVAKKRLPLFVAEGKSQQKLAKIKSEPYLTYCLEKLRSLRGTLVVFGLGFNANDGHIVKAIAQSSVDQMYISYRGRIDSLRNSDRINRIERINAIRIAAGRPPARIVYFLASEASVWK